MWRSGAIEVLKDLSMAAQDRREREGAAVCKTGNNGMIRGETPGRHDVHHPGMIVMNTGILIYLMIPSMCACVCTLRL